MLNIPFLGPILLSSRTTWIGLGVCAFGVFLMATGKSQEGIAALGIGAGIVTGRQAIGDIEAKLDGAGKGPGWPLPK